MNNDAVQAPAEVLDPQECWNLLRSVRVGRLAVWLGDRPDIFPINYTVDHGTVVFRTGTGTKLDAALSEFPVAMEVDGVNEDTGVAWSVVLHGKAVPLKAPEDVVDSFALPLFPWQAGRKDHFVRIPADSISGRRFTVTAPLTWWTPYSGIKPSSVE
ncbi:MULTISPECIES: pyridoxamine 5'-phosphate oxidase family protein [Arthrobacter]|uniref:Pyridoxamine 5'-phosphate oxidase family protein n=1 Tax=Arthrobacter methylotrophus TaxID=121291 RepID=A0ABV5UKP4_9MICC|nr:pyridoxamine 5'-phosphate oxidase family protein [Arthrobacter sp. MA-N2]